MSGLINQATGLAKSLRYGQFDLVTSFARSLICPSMIKKNACRAACPDVLLSSTNFRLEVPEEAFSQPVGSLVARKRTRNLPKYPNVPRHNPRAWFSSDKRSGGGMSDDPFCAEGPSWKTFSLLEPEIRVSHPFSECVRPLDQGAGQKRAFRYFLTKNQFSSQRYMYVLCA